MSSGDFFRPLAFLWLEIFCSLSNVRQLEYVSETHSIRVHDISRQKNVSSACLPAFFLSSHLLSIDYDFFLIISVSFNCCASHDLLTAKISRYTNFYEISEGV